MSRPRDGMLIAVMWLWLHSSCEDGPDAPLSTLGLTLVDADLKGAAEPLHLLLELLHLLLLLLLLRLQASLGFQTLLEVLVQAVHLLFQAFLPTSGCFGELLRSLKFLINFLYLHLCQEERCYNAEDRYVDTLKDGMLH